MRCFPDFKVDFIPVNTASILSLNFRDVKGIFGTFLSIFELLSNSKNQRSRRAKVRSPGLPRETGRLPVGPAIFLQSFLCVLCAHCVSFFQYTPTLKLAFPRSSQGLDGPERAGVRRGGFCNTHRLRQRRLARLRLGCCISRKKCGSRTGPAARIGPARGGRGMGRVCPRRKRSPWRRRHPSS